MTQSNLEAEPPKPLNGLFKWIRIFFIIYIISSAIYALGCGLSLTTESSMFGPDEPFSIGDGIEGISALILALSFIVCIVLFSIFSYRAIKNIHIFGESIDTKPGWAVGWYFIPFANLWKPYGVMSDMWYGSHSQNDPDWDTPKGMPLWWTCWIVGNIASNASNRMGMRAGILNDYASDVPLYKTTLYLDIFSAATGIIAAWVILGILRVIAEKQDLRINADAFD